MEINRLTVNEAAFLVLKELAQSFDNKIDFMKESDDLFSIVLDDKDAEILAEKIKGKLVLEGFDYFYNLTPEGRIFERLVDKLGEIGW